MKRTPFLEQTASDETFAPEVAGPFIIETVHLARRFALLSQVHDVGRSRLHFVGKFVGENPSGHLRFVRMSFEMLLVESLQ